MRFVVDTNVIVSALLIPDSTPRRAFDKHSVKVRFSYLSQQIVELADVLSREKLNRYLRESERMRFLIGLLKEAELVHVTTTITACRDPKDNKFLDLAVDGKANCLITADADLLVLNPFLGIPVLTPTEFLSDEPGQSIAT